MDERPKSGWQAWLAGALFLGLIAAALLLNRREPTTERPAAPAPVVSASGRPPPPVVVVPEAPLDRAQLIHTAMAAADSFAHGAVTPDDQATLAGRRFELRLPFGCAGPLTADDDGQTGWRYDAKGETLRVSAMASDWSKAPWLPAAVDAAVVAEGFPIERPWLLDGRCPERTASATAAPASTPSPRAAASPSLARPVKPPAKAAEPSAPTLGLVQFFGADAPRSQRSDRGYTAVIKRPAAAVTPDLSFSLVLRGRVAAFRDGRSIACWGDAWAARPNCLIAARIETVAIVDNSGAELARWEP